MGRFWFREAKTIAAGNKRELAIVVRHLLEAAVVCLWVFGVCRMPFWTYALCFVYAGTGLALVRSFAEHRSKPLLRSGPLSSKIHRSLERCSCSTIFTPLIICAARCRGTNCHDGIG